MKCLIEKLNGSLGSDSLVPALGEFRIDVNVTTAETSANGKSMNFVGIFSARVVGNGYIGKSENDISHTSLSFSGGSDNKVYFSTGTYSIFISSYYEINGTDLEQDIDGYSFVNYDKFQYSLGGNNWISDVFFGEEVDLSAFKNASFLQLIPVKRNLVGDVDDLAGSTSITGLVLDNNNEMKGDIKSLSSCLSLVNLFVVNTKVGGTLESLANGMYNNGRISGTMNVHAQSSNVTYNGSAITSNMTVTFTANGPQYA